jgi:hypothetical protein
MTRRTPSVAESRSNGDDTNLYSRAVLRIGLARTVPSCAREQPKAPIEPLACLLAGLTVVVRSPVVLGIDRRGCGNLPRVQEGKVHRPQRSSSSIIIRPAAPSPMKDGALAVKVMFFIVRSEFRNSWKREAYTEPIRGASETISSTICLLLLHISFMEESSILHTVGC